MQTLTDTLTERVDKIVQADRETLLSGTAPSLVIRELLARNEAMENAIHEIAFEVEKLSLAQR